jgi:endonuclease/exonuclease/phosphatase family metal-dependent hydrolase
VVLIVAVPVVLFALGGSHSSDTTAPCPAGSVGSSAPTTSDCGATTTGPGVVLPPGAPSTGVSSAAPPSPTRLTPPPDLPPVAVRLTLMTYTIHAGATHGRYLAQVAADIKASGASVVVLNEVDQYPGRPPQAETLGRALGMYDVYGANSTLNGRLRGNAILSKYPIEDPTNTPLPWRPGTEQRGLLSAYVDMNGVVVHVAATHLQFTKVRYLQARRVSALIGEPDCATFVLGDMNSYPTSATHAALTAHLVDTFADGRFGDGFTSEAADPRHRIDDVLHSSQVTPVAALVMPQWTSDHRAVRATFSLLTSSSCVVPRTTG